MLGGAELTGRCPRGCCWVPSRPPTEEALRPSPWVEAGARRGGRGRKGRGSSVSPAACPTEREGPGDTWTLCARQKRGAGGGEGCAACVPTFAPRKGGRRRPSVILCPAQEKGSPRAPRQDVQGVRTGLRRRFSRDDPRFYSHTSVASSVEAALTHFLPSS